jgi:glycosyltransferase involved in cell wall biosynthesis
VFNSGEQEFKMKLSIIMPCYNEVDTITEIVKRLKAIEIEDAEIIVIDDASNDGTSEVLEAEIKPLVSKYNVWHK